MTSKRQFYLDVEHGFTVYLIHCRFSQPGVNPEALMLELRKFQLLYSIKVHQCVLDNSHQLLQLLITVPATLLSPSEADARCKAYDQMLTDGCPAVGNLPAIPPQPNHRKHHYPAKRLVSVPDFMHDLMWCVCHRTQKYRLAEAARLPEDQRDKARHDVENSAVRVIMKYLCHAMEQSLLPRALPEEMLNGLTPAPVSTNAKRQLKPASQSIYVSRHAIGSLTFVRMVEGYVEHPTSKRERKRVRRVTNRTMGEIAREVSYADYLFNEMLQTACGTPLLDSFMEIFDMPPSGVYMPATGGLAVMIATLPLVMGLWLVDGMLRWRKRQKLEESGELAQMRREAMDRAAQIYA